MLLFLYYFSFFSYSSTSFLNPLFLPLCRCLCLCLRLSLSMVLGWLWKIRNCVEKNSFGNWEHLQRLSTAANQHDFDQIPLLTVFSVLSNTAVCHEQRPLPMFNLAQQFAMTPDQSPLPIAWSTTVFAMIRDHYYLVHPTQLIAMIRDHYQLRFSITIQYLHCHHNH